MAKREENVFPPTAHERAREYWQSRNQEMQEKVFNAITLYQPCGSIDLVPHLTVSRKRITVYLLELCKLKRIKVVGAAKDAGRIDIVPWTHLYAPIDAPMLPRAKRSAYYEQKPKPLKVVIAPPPVRVRSAPYRGEKAGPRYWKFTTDELTPKHYDLRAHMRMAMGAR